MVEETREPGENHQPWTGDHCLAIGSIGMVMIIRILHKCKVETDKSVHKGQ